MSFDTEQLIGCVFKWPVLWDVSNKYFKVRKVTSQAWKEVCNDLKTNDDVFVKKRWKTLKDYYRTEIKKLNTPKSGSSRSPAKESVWPYFKQMSFIRDTLGVNNRPCSLLKSEFTTAVSQSANTSSSMGSEAVNIFGSTETQADVNEVPVLAMITAHDETAPTVRMKKPKTRKRVNDFKETCNEKERKKLALLEEASKEDDDILFLHSLLPDIKSLPRTEKLKLRMDMQRLVYDAVLRQEPRSFGHVSSDTYTSSINSPVTDTSNHDYGDSNIR